MNLNKDTPQTKSEKAAVKALIEASLMNVSPQKSSLPVLDSWVLQKITKNSKKGRENKEPNLKMEKRTAQPLPPTSRNAVRTCSSLCKSSREKNTFQIPLVPMTYPNEAKQLIQIRARLCKKAKTRSNSLAESKAKETYMEIPEIKKVLQSIIIKNNLLSKLKSDINKKSTAEFLKHHAKVLQRFVNS